MFKIIDCQGVGTFQSLNFKTKRDVIEQLASYHDIDYKGVKDDDEPYNDIYEFLNTLEDDEKRLEWLVNYGEWDVGEVLKGYKCPNCGNWICKDKVSDGYFGACLNCDEDFYEFELIK